MEDNNHEPWQIEFEDNISEHGKKYINQCVRSCKGINPIAISDVFIALKVACEVLKEEMGVDFKEGWNSLALAKQEPRAEVL